MTVSSPVTPARFPGSDLSYLLSFSPTSPIKALYYAEGESDSDSDTVVSLTPVTPKRPPTALPTPPPSLNRPKPRALTLHPRALTASLGLSALSGSGGSTGLNAVLFWDDRQLPPPLTGSSSFSTNPGDYSLSARSPHLSTYPAHRAESNPPLSDEVLNSSHGASEGGRSSSATGAAVAGSYQMGSTDGLGVECDSLDTLTGGLGALGGLGAPLVLGPPFEPTYHRLPSSIYPTHPPQAPQPGLAYIVNGTIHPRDLPGWAEPPSASSTLSLRSDYTLYPATAGVEGRFRGEMLSPQRPGGGQVDCVSPHRLGPGFRYAGMMSPVRSGWVGECHGHSRFEEREAREARFDSRFDHDDAKGTKGDGSGHRREAFERSRKRSLGSDSDSDWTPGSSPRSRSPPRARAANRATKRAVSLQTDPTRPPPTKRRAVSYPSTSSTPLPRSSASYDLGRLSGRVLKGPPPQKPLTPLSDIIAASSAGLRHAGSEIWYTDDRRAPYGDDIAVRRVCGECHLEQANRKNVTWRMGSLPGTRRMVLCNPCGLYEKEKGRRRAGAMWGIRYNTYEDGEFDPALSVGKRRVGKKRARQE